MIRSLGGIALVAMLGTVLSVGVAGPAAAQRIACGASLYVVQPGDSLSAIAQRAYSSFNYQAIFEANRDVLASPSVLDVGQELFVPCLDGSGPRSRLEATGAASLRGLPEDASITRTALTRPLGQTALTGEPEPGADATLLPAGVAPAGAEPAAVELAAAPANRAVPALDQPVRFLTGSDYAPFTHRDLPEGGMITELVNRAMLRADPLRPYRITWDNDWNRHLTELLPGPDYDLGFPWFRPDCSVQEKLSEAMRRRCADFGFSQPIYEVVIGYYVRGDDPLRRAGGHRALFGKRLCRPADYFTFDLEALDLVAPNIEPVTPEGPGDCFALLSAGQVDVVAVDTLLGEREIAAQDLAGRAVEVPALAEIQTLHAIAAKSDPFGRSWLALVDRGLEMLRREGVWSEVTRRHMAAHGGRL